MLLISATGVFQLFKKCEHQSSKFQGTEVTHFPFSCALLGLTWFKIWGDFLFHSWNFSCVLQYFKFYNLNSIKKMLKPSFYPSTSYNISDFMIQIK